MRLFFVSLSFFALGACGESGSNDTVSSDELLANNVPIETLLGCHIVAKQIQDGERVVEHGLVSMRISEISVAMKLAAVSQANASGYDLSSPRYADAFAKTMDQQGGVTWAIDHCNYVLKQAEEESSGV